MGNNPRVEEPYDLSPEHTVLLGVDFQKGFGDGAWEHTPDAAAAVANFRAAAASWRAAGGRVILCREIYYPGDYLGPDGEPIEEVVRHHPLMSGKENAEFYPDLVEPDDLVMRKTGFSAVAAGALLDILAQHGWDTVVMGGLTTPICVGTTSDDLSMAGVKVVILEDACASQSFEGVSAQDAHSFALARFRYQFGQTMTASEFSDLAVGLAAAKQA
ncbi:MAG TPA: cysteine hydrolase [Jatrophihabitans sp.]|jgi:ureidoacrylate peracid hydrolase|uniref:cysteine hydrolase family protein n=1 Tax=Jatrophihabitans sp. TaxID=1932789 RepID=UPI002DFFD8E5|nr:cysteine hydrolase [Jatrophihabitans sp.]